MTQALYAHMNNKRKKKKNVLKISEGEFKENTNQFYQTLQAV
jgi:hypothetical protein